MWMSKLKEMSVGPLWVLRDKAAAHQPAAEGLATQTCPVCQQPWLQFASDNRKAIAILAAPVTDPAQLTLLQNCLRAVEWGDVAVMSLHADCAENAELAVQVLQAQLAESSDASLIVFGQPAAQRLNPTFNRGQVHRFNDARLVVTHHPEQVLADRALKAAVWADLCLAAYDV